MKFNKLIFMLTVTFVAAMVVGCSNGTESPQKVTQENTATLSEGQKVALPEEQPALIGKVKEIVGNEVTVFKGEVSQNEGTPNEGAPNEGAPNEGAPKEESVSEEAQEKINAIREKVANGTITPEQAREELQNLGLQPNQNPNRGMKFTEQTETFIIPVGTPIVTMQRGTNEANQVGLTEIKKDTILRIWKKDGTVTFVQVISAMGNRQGAGGNVPGAGGGMPPGMGFGPPAGMGGGRQ